MIKWNRGQNIQLSKNFTSKEFECSCGKCVDQQISQELINKLQTIRDTFGPIRINSGYRCEIKQAELKKSGHQTAIGKSTHELGLAVDISASDIIKLRSEVDKLFNSIGTAKTFLHIDLRPLKADGTKRLWSY